MHALEASHRSASTLGDDLLGGKVVVLMIAYTFFLLGGSLGLWGWFVVLLVWGLRWNGTSVVVSSFKRSTCYPDG